MTDTQHDTLNSQPTSERELELERRIGSRTILLVIISMIASIEFLILLRPLLK